MKSNNRPNDPNALAISFIVALAFFATSAIAEKTIQTKLFDPGYLVGDCNYHSLNTASDGMLYFSVCTHQTESSARIYRFNPKNESITQIGDLGNILDEDPHEHIPQGKIHSGLIEHEGYLYFSTHTSFYEGNLPNMTPGDGRKPYTGGHLMRYNLKTGVFEDLTQIQLANEGIIAMTVDKTSDTLYGLTWPTGLLISYQLEEKRLHNWGATQGRGEWGRLPGEWDFICRKLGIDDKGNLYGSTDTGSIWHFEKGKQRPLDYLKDLNVAHVAPIQKANFETPAKAHFFWNNWRTILWNPDTQSFWGLQGGSTQLFEFTPTTGVLRSVRSLRPEGVPLDTRRNPFRSQLGFMLGPDNTLIYLAHAPGIRTEGKSDLKSSVHLLTYRIDTDQFHDHGALVTRTGRRIFFTESVEIGSDDHIYSVAWVESIDPSNKERIQSARGEAAPDETEDVIYEMQLVQMPTWQKLFK